MEASKENIFKIEYTSVLGEKISKKEKWTSKLGKFIAKNKLITATIIIFFMCLVLNFILIYNFIEILENM